MHKLLFIASFTLFTQIGIAQPCSSPFYDQFDFWVGSWEVYDTKGDTLVGLNTIRKILNGCVIEENWTGISGYQGKSFNTFNPVDSTWNQVWVDVGGNTYHFKGGYTDNHMALKGETQIRGNLVLFTLDFYYDEKEDTVQQIWKKSDDYGENWTIIFDGTYKRKKGDN